MLKKLDLLAIELFAEFGFATCSEEQQEKILQEFVERGLYLATISQLVWSVERLQ